MIEYHLRDRTELDVQTTFRDCNIENVGRQRPETAAATRTDLDYAEETTWNIIVTFRLISTAN